MPISEITQKDLVYRKQPTKNGIREVWTYNGAYHNINDDPAVIINGGEELQWWMHGHRHRPEYLGPAWIKSKSGISTYYNLGEIHRRNGPAMITPTGWKWYFHGKVSRLDGPAIYDSEYYKSYIWYYNGSPYSFEEWVKASGCSPELYILLKLEYG